MIVNLAIEFKGDPDFTIKNLRKAPFEFIYNMTMYVEKHKANENYRNSYRDRITQIGGKELQMYWKDQERIVQEKFGEIGVPEWLTNNKDNFDEYFGIKRKK